MSENKNSYNANEKEGKEMELTSLESIIITPQAYRKLVLHVLRFSNDSSEEKIEVVGLCLGSTDVDNNSIEIVDTIPISHGEHLQLGLSKEEYDQIIQIQEETSELDQKIVGWYSSHPGYGNEFLSDAEKKSHQYFQNDESPHAFCIVIDVDKLKEGSDTQFRAFKLKDYKKAKEEVEIPIEVKAPDSLDYFKWIQAVVEESQRKTPRIIKEFNEIIKPMPEDLQEIPLGEADVKAGEVKGIQSELSPVFDGFKEGMTNFTDSFLDTYRLQLTNWMDDFNQGTLKSSEYLRSSMSLMYDAISRALDGTQKYLETKLSEITEIFENSISEYIQRRIGDQANLKEEIINDSSKISDELEGILEESFNDISKDIQQSAKTVNEKINGTLEAREKINDLLNTISENITTITNKTNSFSEEVVQDVSNLKVPFEAKLIEEFENLSTSLIPVKEKHSEITALIERLQKVISEFRQIK